MLEVLRTTLSDLGAPPIVTDRVALISIVLLALCIFIDHRRTYANLPGPRGWPIIGHTVEELINIDISLERSVRRFREEAIMTANFKILSQPHFVVTTDPRVVQHILSSNFDNYIKGPDWHRRFKDLLGDGIFNVDGKLWYLHRKLSSRMFSTGNFRDNMLKVFLRHGETVVGTLDGAAASGAPLDLQDLFLRFTLDSIGDIAFGEDVGSLTQRDVPFATAFDFCQHVTNERFLLPFWEVVEPLLPRGRQMRANLKILDEYTFALLARRRATHAEGGEAAGGPRDLLSHFIGREDAEGQPFDDRMLRDIVMNFIIAGRDTTAQLLSWTFYLLTQHPEVEARLLAEVEAALGGGGVTWEGLKQMRYAHAVLMETLRLYPSVPKDAKCAAADDVLPDGTQVRKGMFVGFLPYAMGRSPRLWGESAEVFDPERWLRDECAMREPNLFKFTAFQAGPRRCLGMDMAHLEAKAVLATLLPRFRFALAPGARVMMNQRTLTLPMLHGLQVVVKPR